MDNNTFSSKKSHKTSNSDQQSFEEIEEIGSGTYGIVKKGRMKKDGTIIAIKKIKVPIENEGIPSTALREISILKCLNHNNIVKLNSTEFINNKICLIFEYLDIDLRKYLTSLNDNDFLDQEVIKSLLFQLLDGMAYCHGMKIMHRDLKPQNLLVDKEGVLKIGDFGLARSFGIPVRPYTKEVATLWYRAPEILLGCVEYSTPIDMWSIGCIFAELVLKKPLFHGEYELDTIFKIFKILGTPNVDEWRDLKNFEHYSSEFPKWEPTPFEELFPNLEPSGIELMKMMLCYDPNLRITAKNAMKHPYFESIIENNNPGDGANNHN